jgi:serine phosphatase RsbU (regulator of sigma subunit)
LALAPGSLLALYTDGLVEDRHRGLDFDDLLRAVDDLEAGPAADPAAAALAVMAATVRGQSADDVALLVASLPDPAVRPLNGRAQIRQRARFGPASPG